jgi:hypothetical protein
MYWGLVQSSSSPSIAMLSGGAAHFNHNSDASVDTWNLVTVVFGNGNDSYLQVNDEDPVVGSSGSSGTGTLVIGNYYAGSHHANFDLSEMIVSKDKRGIGSSGVAPANE